MDRTQFYRALNRAEDRQSSGSPLLGRLNANACLISGTTTERWRWTVERLKNSICLR